ncbi:MAG TPA: hypothetical protein VJC21_00620 [Candidatus Nanoarchaeia archaeon]|nr:hypothetical protein [Candidatus Nanoarchaeia archaeon]
MFGLFKKKGEAKKEESHDDCCGSGCCSDGGDCGCEHEGQKMEGSCGCGESSGCSHEEPAGKEKKHGGCGCC